MAEFSQLLASKPLPPEGLVPFLACRLIALDKNPGVRPIGVCEVFRRITTKSILKVVGPDVETACGRIQKCSGLPAGIESAVHAMQQIYEDPSTEAVLLVDATNAFNSLNRSAGLHNIQRLCPALARTVVNCYQSPARLFVAGGGELQSAEGTTQGDPLSMAFYALATLPLVDHLHEKLPDIRQGWYADDSGAAGVVQRLRSWWDDLCDVGDLYGYHPNSAKTVLLVKPDKLEAANAAFEGTGIRVVTGGVKYLGGCVGEQADRCAFINRKIGDWVAELKTLTAFAETEPHAAYSALTHGLRGRWTYVLRTLSVDETFLEPLDSAVLDLAKVITSRSSFTEEELAVLRLPVRFGGLNLPYFAKIARQEYTASKEVTVDQVNELLHQDDLAWPSMSPNQIRGNAMSIKAQLHRRHLKSAAEAFVEVKSGASGDTARRLERLSKKGVSSWLTTLPLSEHGYLLNKREFRDALALRYDWPILDLPETCICGKEFTVEHAMCCPRGGFPTLRHNEVRDLLADLMTEVSGNVATEPLLLPVTSETFSARTTNTSDEARADIRATGFWTRGEEAFFDVRVFHADAPSYKGQDLDTLLVQHENRKKLEYGERIRNVDRGSFAPLVFTTDGCAAPEATRFLKSLCSRLANRDGKPYSVTLAYVRGRLSFALLRAAIMCLRGARSSYHRPINALRQLAISEGCF